MLPWPRKLAREAAYLVLPFTFVGFLVLLTGALLVTWGHLSAAVLIGFSVTAGLLVGLFLLCHLVVHCSVWAWAEEDAETDPESAASPTSFFARVSRTSRVSSLGRAARADCRSGSTARHEGAGGHVRGNNQGVGRPSYYPGHSRSCGALEEKR